MRNICQGRPLDRAIYVQTQIGQSKMRNLSQRRPLGQAIYVKTQTGHSKMRNLHQRDHLKRAIYIQTQIGHLRMRNLCQGTTRPRNLHPNLNRPLKNEHLRQRHKQSYMTHTNTQPHKACKNKHTRFMQIFKITKHKYT